ncbi:MAG: penicillin-binding transpeptidase domain-containing protein [Patescibacteria group bacterium]|nr:penicillin-binding transpeptidase domain-containing protein [Patescibacteria group bacterium]
MIDEDLIFQQSGRRVKESNNRNLSWLFFGLIFLVVVSYFYFLQFFLKKELVLAEAKMKHLSFFSFPPRGIIFDRFGKVIASTEKSFDIYIDLSKYNHVDDLNIKGNFFYRGNQLIIRNVPREIALDLTLREKDLPYLKVVPSYHRVYLGSEEIGNVIGFIGFPTKGEKNFYPEEFIGKTGIEMVYQNYLRGQLGEIVYLREDDNNLKKIKEILPLPGDNVTLTLDWEFQKLAYELIKNYFSENDYQRGAFIALDPNTGEIISLISYPSYDPKLLLNKETALKVLNNPNEPIFNRAISGLYSPGSTIKPIVAVAALEEKIVTPETQIYAEGKLTLPNPYFPGQYTVFRDNKFHGWTDVRKAIADSVNIYFYVVGGGYPYQSENIPVKNGLGIYKLLKYWQLYNLGQKTGIDLNGEEDGFLPSPEKKSQKFTDRTWRLGDTYNVAIGQGDLLVTPLQIAIWTAALATNKIYQPFLVKKISKPSGQIILERKPLIIKSDLVSQESLKIVQDGMRQTVTKGTAKMLNSLPVSVAGKSGTPEIFGKRKLNAIFTGYFPYEKPEVVMTLLIEDVPLGSVATLPLYYQLVKAYLNLNLDRNGRTNI